MTFFKKKKKKGDLQAKHMNNVLIMLKLQP